MAGASKPEKALVSEAEKSRKKPKSISSKLQRIAELAQQAPKMSFTSLAYNMDVAWLREAFRRIRKDGAPGIDGVTAKDYAVDLEDNLRSLLDRAKSGRYRAPPVRRAYIPKRSGTEKRALGIPTLEDKVLQKAVQMLLEPIFEQDFLPCSFAYRPKRSPHDALAVIRDEFMEMGGGCLIELDIRKYFDSIDHRVLREFLSQRVCDGVLTRLINKWLHAGVMEDGRLHYPDSGTPQGGVISPLLANLFLHHVLDVWFEQEIRPLLKGRCFLVRFADDAVLGFTSERDAQRVYKALFRRFERFGLQLHPDKTRLVDFRRPGRSQGTNQAPSSGTFQFLGLTHYWGISRSKRRVVKRRTAKDSLRRAICRITLWCRKHRHWKVRDQHRSLVIKLRGHYNYYGINGNWESLEQVRKAAARAWKYWLNRRSENRHVNWKRFNQILERYPLHRPRIRHHNV